MSDWDDVPADLAFRLRHLRYVYDVHAGYRRAGAQNNTVGWTKANPDGWELVTSIMQRRRRSGD